MKILIIEDDKLKIEKLLHFFEAYEVVLKESYQGGMSELKDNWHSYSFLILDMTIPLWEKGRNELGGNYEQFGGERILREMSRKKIYIPTILFTMFDVFPAKNANITFQELHTLFSKEFQHFYRGSVFYNSNDESWKNELQRLIDADRK
jgi:hypothetical protein